jgi:hypothetical protein
VHHRAGACRREARVGRDFVDIPDPGAPQLIRAGSSKPEKEKWLLALSQPRSSPPSSLNGLRAIISAVPDNSSWCCLNNAGRLLAIGLPRAV